MQYNYSSVDFALVSLIAKLKEEGISEDSRNGPVLRFAQPALLVNDNPLNRVSFLPQRDANPFFHFMEGLWMLAGMNEVAPMRYYNGNIGAYSDDGVILRGTAYGHKWRYHFGYDQLNLAITRLRDNPTDRRIVLTMWDPRQEWRDRDSKDLSCNLQVIFSTRPLGSDHRALDMTVTNRSNDLIWGCLGSNVFHFTMLQEFVACHAGLAIGHYYQFANNLHVYTENEVYKRVETATYEDEAKSRPPSFLGSPRPLMRDLFFQNDPEKIRNFLLTGDPGGDSYLQKVAQPLWDAYRVFKLKSRGYSLAPMARREVAVSVAQHCADEHLATAAVRWLERRVPGESVL